MTPCVYTEYSRKETNYNSLILYLTKNHAYPILHTRSLGKPGEEGFFKIYHYRQSTVNIFEGEVMRDKLEKWREEKIMRGKVVSLQVAAGTQEQAKEISRELENILLKETKTPK